MKWSTVRNSSRETVASAVLIIQTPVVFSNLHTAQEVKTKYCPDNFRLHIQGFHQ